MTISLEAEVLESATAENGEFIYVLARNGRRWTVRMPADWMAKTPDANQRRAELEKGFEQVMHGHGSGDPGEPGDADRLERLADSGGGCLLAQLNARED